MNVSFYFCDMLWMFLHLLQKNFLTSRLMITLCVLMGNFTHFRIKIQKRFCIICMFYRMCSNRYNGGNLYSCGGVMPAVGGRFLGMRTERRMVICIISKECWQVA